MPRDASGNYVRPTNSFSNPVTLTVINSTDADSLFDDFESAMNMSAIKTPQYLLTSASLALPNAVVATAGAGLVASASATQFVIKVGAGTGITVNPNDVQLSAINPVTVLANTSAGTAVPVGTTLSALIDAAIASANVQGSLLYRGASGWAALAPATSGSFLKTFGAGANPDWATIPGGGDMLAANNLSDVATADQARANIGVQGHNHLINGSMRISQRGTSFTSANNANNNDVYTLDRWNLLSDGNNVVDVTQSALGATANPYIVQFAVATTAKKFGIIQFVENFDCAGLRGTNATLSFRAAVSNATRLPNIKAAILSWQGTADVLTSNIVSTWNAHGTTPTATANWTFENTPANLSVTTSWADKSVTALIDSATANNIAAFIWCDDASAANVNDQLYISNVQLEAGVAASPFTRRAYSEELTLAQRYYHRKSSSTGGAPFDVLNVFSLFATQGGWGKFYDLPVTMRVIPTVAASTANHIGAFFTVPGTVNFTALTLNGQTKGSIASYGGFTTTSASAAIYSAIIVHFTNASGYIEASAEL